MTRSLSSFWLELDLGDRRAAAERLLAEEARRAELQEWIGRRLHFRPASVARLALDRQAEVLARSRPPSPDAAQGLFRALLSGPLRPVAAAFQAALGLPDPLEEGQLPPAVLPEDEGGLRRALGPVVENHGGWADARVRAILAWLALRAEAPGALARLLEAAEPAVQGPEEPAPAAETCEEFTTLDDFLRAAVVAAVEGIEGALDPDQARDLVEETLQLNATRRRTYFHLGFLDGLQDRAAAFGFPAEDQGRRLWYLAGFLLALIRRDRREALLELVGERAGLLGELFQLGGARAQLCARPFFEALLRAGRAAEAATLLGPVPAAEEDLPGQPFGRMLLESATDLLRQGEYPQAALLLDCLLRAAELRDGLPLEPYPPDFRHVAARRRAHCHRRQGDLERARMLLEGLVAECPPDQVSFLHTDLFLVRAGRKGLHDVLIPLEPERRGNLLALLESGETELRALLGRGVDAHPRFLLGLLHLLRQEDRPAEAFLDQAYTLMSRDLHAYREEGILQMAGFYLARVLLNQGERDRISGAGRLLHEAIVHERAGRALPPDYLREALEALLILEAEDLAVRCAEALLERGHGFLDTLRQAGVAGRSPRIFEALRARAFDAARPLLERWEDLAGLLRAQASRPDAALELLDGLLELSRLDPLRTRALELLEELGENLATSPEDLEAIRWKQAELHLAGGERAAAGALLEPLFWAQIRLAAPHRLEEAEELLEVLGELLPAEALQGLEAALARSKRSEPASGGLEPFPCRLLIVGGDEAQERYREALQERFSAWPGLKLDLFTPAFSSNWGIQFDQLRHRLEQADALILLRRIRTHLGRVLRKACSELGKPWISCSGHGRDSLIHSVERALRLLGGR